MTRFDKEGVIMFNVNTINYLHLYCYNLNST